MKKQVLSVVAAAALAASLTVPAWAAQLLQALTAALRPKAAT